MPGRRLLCPVELACLVEKAVELNRLDLADTLLIAAFQRADGAPSKSLFGTIIRLRCAALEVGQILTVPDTRLHKPAESPHDDGGTEVSPTRRLRAV